MAKCVQCCTCSSASIPTPLHDHCSLLFVWCVHLFVLACVCDVPSAHRRLSGTSWVSFFAFFSFCLFFCFSFLFDVSLALSESCKSDLHSHYLAIGELLRHFWSCFPARTKQLEEKVLVIIRFYVSIQNFSSSLIAKIKHHPIQLPHTLFYVCVWVFFKNITMNRLSPSEGLVWL